jgi:hypothetical protein
MDECGILACSETNYFGYTSTINNERRTTGSLQTIYTLHDSSIPACFTIIQPVNIAQRILLETDGSKKFRLTCYL